MSEPTKETINRRLTEFDDRVDHWHEWEVYKIGMSVQICTRCREFQRDLNVNPDYCSSYSPRSLIEGLEAQLPNRLMLKYIALLDANKNLMKGYALTTALGEEKAKAIYEVLESKPC